MRKFLRCFTAATAIGGMIPLALHMTGFEVVQIWPIKFIAFSAICAVIALAIVVGLGDE